MKSSPDDDTFISDCILVVHKVSADCISSLKHHSACIRSGKQFE
jgi:hypothetical protein